MGIHIILIETNGYIEPCFIVRNKKYISLLHNNNADTNIKKNLIIYVSETLAPLSSGFNVIAGAGSDSDTGYTST